MIKRYVISLLSLLLLLISIPQFVHADTVAGQSIYTLGEDLTKEQRDKLLKEMEYKDGEKIITVSNKEEHTYLGSVIPAAQIGTQAFSSSKITMKSNKTGINVISHNISWVTPEMYTNALVTAGVKDAEIYVTAPFTVSGTAALTGLMKAYELSSGKKIDEETKKIANEEMVTTAKLGSDIGEDKANSLITNIKQEIAKEQPKTTEDIRTIVLNISHDLNINIDKPTEEKLVALFEKMNNANVDWNNVKEQIDIATKQWGDTFQQIDPGFFEKLFTSIQEGFSKIWNFITSLFH